MSDAIARELALEACRAAPVGAEMTDRPISDGATDYTIRRGNTAASVRYYGKDGWGTRLYAYDLSERDPRGGWETMEDDAGDEGHVREVLLTWARAL